MQHLIRSKIITPQKGIPLEKCIVYAMKSFNIWIAEKITSSVATMWCAYFFGAIALISLPKALKTGDTIVIVSWVTQTFLQLFLLSIIMVGQKRQSTNFERIINETHTAALLELRELQSISKEIHILVKELEGKFPN